MILITIVNGVYKPRNITGGGPHCRYPRGISYTPLSSKPPARAYTAIVVPPWNACCLAPFAQTGEIWEHRGYTEDILRIYREYLW